ncbi:hypothetical protein CL652_01715 [bacterium]|nr:hypothetical protein [bacterium]
MMVRLLITTQRAALVQPVRINPTVQDGSLSPRNKKSSLVASLLYQKFFLSGKQILQRQNFKIAKERTSIWHTAKSAPQAQWVQKTAQ